MRSYLAIAIGSALGGMARYICAGLAARLLGASFPWGTLLVNVTGSFFIGLFATVTDPEGRLFVAPHWRQFVMIGFCGGYTTFSTFSLETLRLAQDGEFPRVGMNIALSVTLCLWGVWLGHLAGVAINRMR